MSASVQERLLAAIATLHTGERDTARETFAALDVELASTDHVLRCVLAHYMADAQDAAADELQWDQRALDAAMNASPAELEARFPGLTLASFLPSLHLNLAASHEKLGHLVEARDHADRALACSDGLPDTPLAQLTTDAIRRLRARLA